MLTVAAILALLAAPASAKDVTGTWHATVEGDMGPVDLTFTFRQDGEQVTGSVSVGATEAQITDGRIVGDQLTFNLPWGGEAGEAPEVLISYQATVSENAMDVVSLFAGRPDGDAVASEFTARREQ